MSAIKLEYQKNQSNAHAEIKGSCIWHITSIDVEHVETSETFSVLPVNNHFKFVHKLVAGTNTFKLTPNSPHTDYPMQKVDIYNDVEEPEEYNWFNPIDHIGIDLGVDRLRGEKNQRYIQRLFDAGKYKHGTHLEGMMFAIARECGLKTFHDSIYISLADMHDESILVDVNARYISFSRPSWTTKDTEKQSPDTWKVTLSEYPSITSPISVAVDSIALPADMYKIDGKEIKILKPVYGYDVTVSYTKEERYQYESYSDISTLMSQIESDIDGISISVNSSVSSMSPYNINHPVYEMINREDSGANENGIYLSVSRARVYPLHKIADEYLNERGAGYNTKLAGWVKKIRQYSRLSWGDTVLDIDTANSLSYMEDVDYLPHLTDPLRDETKRTDWRSGTGTGDGLRTSLLMNFYSIDDIIDNPDLLLDRFDSDDPNKEEVIPPPAIPVEPLTGFGVSYGRSYGYM